LWTLKSSYFWNDRLLLEKLIPQFCLIIIELLQVFNDGKWRDYNGARESDAMFDHLKTVVEKKGSKGGSKKCPKSTQFSDPKTDAVITLCKEHFPDNKSKNSWLVIYAHFFKIQFKF